jgi:serine/threonine protein kinase
MMGTAAYMPPEQARDTRKADARSDLYSLGCTLFYLLTGRTAFSGTTQMDMILSHVNQPIPSLRQINAQIPLALDRIFQRLVAKSPDDRFQSADELIPRSSGRSGRVSQSEQSSDERGIPAGKEVDSTRKTGSGFGRWHRHNSQ